MTPGDYVVVRPIPNASGVESYRGHTIAKLIRFDGSEAIVARLRGEAVTRNLPPDWVPRPPAVLKPVRVDAWRVARQATSRECQIKMVVDPVPPRGDA